MKTFRFFFVSSTLIAVLLPVFCFSSTVLAEKGLGTEELDLSLGELLNLEVSVATKTQMTVEEAPAIVSVITGNEIENMGARNIMDILRTLPGFDLTHVFSVPNHTVQIRGSGNYNTVKVMLNGHTLHFSSFFERMPIASIKKIEVIRGPGSALYGTGAFFGIINIITKQGGDGPSAIAAEWGSYQSLKSYGEFSYKDDDDFKVRLLADYYTTDGYDGIVESDAATASPRLEGVTPGELTGDGRYFNFQTNMSYKSFYFSGMLNLTKTNSPLGIARTLTDENEVKDKYAYAELGYKTPITDRGNLMIRTFYDYFELDRFWEIFPEETAEMEMHTGFPPGEGLNGQPLSKNSYLGGEIQADYELYPGIQLVGGTSCEYWKQFDVRSIANHNVTGAPLIVDGIKYPGFPFKYFHTGWTDISENGNWVDEGDRTIFAAYTQGIFDLKKLFSLKTGVENLSLTAGVRHDYYDDVGSSTNPRFGIVYSPRKNLYFKALYGTAFRVPTFGELYFKNNPSLTGNTGLHPEELETMEGLIGYNFTRNIKSSLTYFNIRTKNLIIAKNRTYANEGTSETSGVEAEMKFSFDKYKYAYLNFTFQDLKNTTNSTITSDEGKTYVQDDYNPGGVPEIMGNMGINWDFFDEHVIANASLNYVGERDRTGEKKWNGEILANVDDREPTKDRTLVNISLTFRNFLKAMEIQLSCFNIFDADHRDPDPARALKYDMPEPGRWFMGRITYSF